MRLTARVRTNTILGVSQVRSRDTNCADLPDVTDKASTPRIVVATPSTPTETTGAGRRLVGIVRALAETSLVDVVYQVTGGPLTTLDQLPGVRLHPVGGSRGARRLVAYARALVHGVPRGFARGVWPELPAAVAVLDDGSCRVVADGPVAAAALARIATRRPVIYNAHNVESSFRHLIDDPDAGSRRRLEAFERSIMTRSAETWMVSLADVRRAGSIAPSAHVRRVPNVVDRVELSIDERPGQNTVLFLGDATYEPNRRAVRFIVEELAPVLRRRAPHVRVVVAGRGSRDAAPETLPNLDVLGFVDDVEALYAGAGCAVVPLREGGGSPIKFLEALAHGVPVVATRLAAAGLDGVCAGVHYLEVEATGADVAAAVCRALDDRTGDGLARAGRAVIERDYSVEALTRMVAP